MHYRLHLSIRYDFARPTGGGRQLLRICPSSLTGLQQVDQCNVTISPRPDERRHFPDFFGTSVVQVAMPAGADSCTFDMCATVRRMAVDLLLDLSAPFDLLTAELARITDLGPHSPHHFLRPSPRIPDDPDIARFAVGACAAAPTARTAVEALGLALRDHMQFDALATKVDTPVDVAFHGRRGVCQDYAQIMIAGLRALGIPAAYVSGFLRTQPPPGKARLVGADAMHAWVRAWTGTEAGWIEYDPTNGCFVSADHVAIGYGRDYGDAAPVTGAMRLSGGQTSRHSVDIAPFGDQETS